MTYKGAFAAKAAANPSGSNRPSRLNWGTGVDPKHSNDAWGDDQGFPALTDSQFPYVPANIEDSFRPTDEGEYSQPYEREPSGHDGYTGHEANLGATLKNTANTVARSISQTFNSQRTQSFLPSPGESGGTYTGQALRALRGDNSLNLNNPGSADVNGSGNYIRAGWELNRITDRRMPLRRLTHTKRPVYENLASTAHVTSTPQGDNYSPYSSPFRSVSTQNVGTAWPMQRREPRPWDETSSSDGSEYSYADDWAQQQSWGL